MSRVKKVCSIVAIIIFCLGVVVCSAKDGTEVSNAGALLLVVDKSKESYGIQLVNEVYTQLEKQLKLSGPKDKELQAIIQNCGIEDIAKTEQPDLLNLAGKTGVNRVLVVEILPTKSEFKEILFYRAIKSESTLKVRLYDAVKQQYILNEEIASTSINKTIMPYTYVGKKVTVLEAVHKAAVIVSQRVYSLENE